MMHNTHGSFLAVLYPLSCLHPSVRRVNMALPQKAAEKERGDGNMASLKENFYEAINLDSIIENGITDTVRDSPDFVTENQKKLSDALTAYTRDILRRNDPETDDEEIYLIIEKRADRLMDIFSETAHAYIKNGMRIGAHLLLQLLNLE